MQFKRKPRKQPVVRVLSVTLMPEDNVRRLAIWETRRLFLEEGRAKPRLVLYRAA